MIKKTKSILGIISVLVAIIGGIVGIIISIKTCSHPERNNPIPNITTKGESSTTIVGNGNTVQRNNIIQNNVSVNTKPNKISYSIIGTSNRILLKDLKTLKKIEIVPDSKNVIEITFTGEISLLDKNSDTYIYSGGNVLIKVDNLNCYEFENLKILEMKPNSKNIIITEIQKNIDNYINNNPKLFLNKITECISKY